MRLQRKEAVRRVEDRDVAAGGQDPIVLVHLRAAIPRQVFDHADRQHEIERAVRPRQPPRLVVGEEPHVPHAAEPKLVDVRAGDLDELWVGVEGVDRRDLALLGQVLRHVAEGAADLQHGEVAGAARAEPAEERVEVQRTARLLEGEIERRPLLLALDEHLDHALAVARRRVGAPLQREHAPITEIVDAILQIGHRREYSVRSSGRRRAACGRAAAAPARCRANAWRA